MPYAAFLHSHVSSWAITLLLFIISFALLKAGKQKGQKITHMILRLFYILTVVTGAGLLFQWKFDPMALLKAVLAIWVISAMELILVRTAKGQAKTSYWIQLAVSLVLVFILGYGVLG
jgi:uncharacterized membrane protein SirB2